MFGNHCACRIVIRPDARVTCIVSVVPHQDRGNSLAIDQPENRLVVVETCQNDTVNAMFKHLTQDRIFALLIVSVRCQQDRKALFRDRIRKGLHHLSKDSMVQGRNNDADGTASNAMDSLGRTIADVTLFAHGGFDFAAGDEFYQFWMIEVSRHR